MQNSNIFYIPPLLPHGRGYKILFEPAAEEGWTGIPQGYWKELDELSTSLINDPKQTEIRLKTLCTQFPRVHAIANMRAFALLKLRKKKEAEKVIEQMADQFPNSLTAKVNFADLCIRKKRFDQIPIIFDRKFDLNLLFPEREEFHYGEFRGFSVVMGYYHLHIKKQEEAKEYYEVAFLVDPLHPAVISLEKVLKKSPSILQKLAQFIKKT